MEAAYSCAQVCISGGWSMCYRPCGQSYLILHLQEDSDCLSHLPVEKDVLQLAGIGLAPLMGPPQTPATGQDTSCTRCLHPQLAAGNNWW